MDILTEKQTYSKEELYSLGFIENEVKDVDYDVFKKDNKVYFFEELGNHNLRLFTVINQKSFFL